MGCVNLSGSIKLLKDTGITCSACSQRSEMTLMKYWGGKGSNRGTTKERWWSTPTFSARKMKSSECKIYSESPSCTIIQKGSADPWKVLSHLNFSCVLKSNSILTVTLVMGWTKAEISSLGNLYTYSRITLPILGNLISSPILYAEKSKKSLHRNCSFLSILLQISLRSSLWSPRDCCVNWRRGVIEYHYYFSTILHKLRRFSDNWAHRFLSAISNKARRILLALCVT